MVDGDADGAAFPCAVEAAGDRRSLTLHRERDDDEAKQDRRRGDREARRPRGRDPHLSSRPCAGGVELAALDRAQDRRYDRRGENDHRGPGGGPDPADPRQVRVGSGLPRRLAETESGGPHPRRDRGAAGRAARRRRCRPPARRGARGRPRGARRRTRRLCAARQCRASAGPRRLRRRPPPRPRRRGDRPVAERGAGRADGMGAVAARYGECGKQPGDEECRADAGDDGEEDDRAPAGREVGLARHRTPRCRGRRCAPSGRDERRVPPDGGPGRGPAGAERRRGRRGRGRRLRPRHAGRLGARRAGARLVGHGLPPSRPPGLSGPRRAPSCAPRRSSPRGATGRPRSGRASR